MKCINKKALPLLLLCVTCFWSGCGTEEAVLENPYDIYSGMESALPSGDGAAEKPYFSKNLCVAEDTEVGTDTTDAFVAEGAGTFNLATNTVVYQKNIYDKLYPASTTKILTAYIALNRVADLNETVTVSENAADQASDSSVCGLKAGDVITMRDLLYGLMLRSGNDAAIAIAEYISGDVESFAELMNQEAARLGAVQSHFVNPNGLPDEDHYTSVYDLYLLFRAALENETFADIIHTRSVDVSYLDAEGGAVTQTWETTNQYFAGNYRTPEGFEIIGGKTGTTGQAGYCLALYSKNASGEPIISIVLKADGKSNLYLLMNEMLEGFAN